MTDNLISPTYFFLYSTFSNGHCHKAALNSQGRNLERKQIRKSAHPLIGDSGMWGFDEHTIHLYKEKAKLGCSVGAYDLNTSLWHPGQIIH